MWSWKTRGQPTSSCACPFWRLSARWVLGQQVCAGWGITAAIGNTPEGGRAEGFTQCSMLPACLPAPWPLQVKCSLLILDLPNAEELVCSLFTTLLDVVK